MLKAIKQLFCRHRRVAHYFEVIHQAEYAALGIEHDYCQCCGKWLN